mmetsp:Transcript_20807/g.49407  ORF Transcript_20807/g.49407 Transcript_20807/m.49407 type:complete len:538 (+) Transcript_20807:95-1708(+)
MTPSAKELVCDYLIVGAGAASMAFIDTLLTELPDTKIILIDRKPSVGGHWVDSYGFVQLHQPSLLYGVASKQLEGNWAKLMMTKFMLPWSHRASKNEILAYFDQFVQEKEDAGQLEFYSNCEYLYDNNQANNNGMYSFSSTDGKQIYNVQVNEKLVDGTAGECIIPSLSPLSFPVDDSVRVMTPNQIYDTIINKKQRSELVKTTKQYVVLGAGKTAMDTVVYLQRVARIKPDNISWVIPNDVWMLNRDGGGNPWVWPKALLERNLDVDQAALELEKKGVFYRLDPNVMPSKFRFPVVDAGELKLMRNVKNIVRRGRAAGIRVTDESNDKKILVEFGDDKPAWEVPTDTVFIHCTSPGPFNNKEHDTIFDTENQLTLNLLVAPPISMSLSNIAKIEAARRNGTLDLDFGRQLLASLEPDSGKKNQQECNLADKYSENDVLQVLIRAFALSGKDSQEPSELRPIVTLATFFAILDVDPTEAYDWQKGNRLQFLSIPGFKVKIFENINAIATKGKELGYSDERVRMFHMLADKLKPLEGM